MCFMLDLLLPPTADILEFQSQVEKPEVTLKILKLL